MQKEKRSLSRRRIFLYAYVQTKIKCIQANDFHRRIIVMYVDGQEKSVYVQSFEILRRCRKCVLYIRYKKHD